MIEVQLGSADWHLRRVERHAAAAAGERSAPAAGHGAKPGL
jgi:hypothetical protein